MTARSDLAIAFLDSAGWSTAARAPLAGDASLRRYERLRMPDGGTAVLMDAAPDKGEDVRPFLHIARHLKSVGLSPPEILAADEDHGFLLIEDLGDALFARVVGDVDEMLLYAAATDVLVELHRHPVPPGVEAYDPERLAELACLSHTWYPERAPDAPVEALLGALRDALAAHDLPPVLALRDYHSENLIWLPEREAPANVGLLDFQDAMAAHPAYDLVSMLQDARRDVPEAVEARMVARYLAASGHAPDAFRAAYALLGLQRNLRILGVFARLSLHFGKAHYVDFIPRVWGFIERNLAHPVCAPLRPLVLDGLPAPTPELLQDLKDRCGTIPTL